MVIRRSRRVYGFLADELLQARIQYWGWITLGVYASWEWRNSVPWVVFLSVYAIVDNNSVKIKGIKAARAANEAIED